MSSKKDGSFAWGIPSGSIDRQGSTDASLFSCSLPVFPHKKLEFPDIDLGLHSVDDNSTQLSKIKDATDDLGLQVMGNFLPDNEDELLAGIMDDFDLNGLPSQLEELEESDIFDSGGGMELEYDLADSIANGLAKTSLNDGYIMGNAVVSYGLTNGTVTVAGEHPAGEHPSRTLFVRNINSNVEDSELRALFEQYGDIRTLYTACKHRGFVMISYYDIRAARTAMRALQNRPLRRRKLDIHFSIPKDNPSDKDLNQGTLVVFNLDPSVSNDDLHKIFGNYGEVKEIRETPHKKHHKFVEFYDVRASEAALRSLNRIDIAGKRIKLEPSRPGGTRRSMPQPQFTQEIDQDDTRSYKHLQMGSSIPNSPPGAWAQYISNEDRSPPAVGNHFSGLNTFLPPLMSSPTKIAPIGKDHAKVNHAFNGNSSYGFPLQHSQSFPEHENGMFSSSSSVSKPSDIGTLDGPQFLWGSPSQSSATWQGKGIAYPSRHAPLLAPSHHYHHHHVGSAPSGISFERQYSYFPDSPDTSFMNPAGYGSSRNMVPRVSINPANAFSRNTSENGFPNFRMMSSQRVRPAFYGNTQYSGVGFESQADRSRSRRVENNATMLDSKNPYQLDLEKIASGEDTRTTLMIKNIPNKYTSKMLLAAIDESHKGTYDFIYLPIDFKNKCNVGYAFLNMVSHSHIISFYEAFHGKKWEKFNSEKVASIAYGRIQGRAALITHFQNSSLMNEDKRCRPILFNSQGAETDDQDAFLSSVHDQDETVLGTSL